MLGLKSVSTLQCDSTALYASMAVESVANAMILELGGDEAKNHKAIRGLAAVLRRVKPELLREERYVQLVSKRNSYSKKARRIINNAKFVVEEVK